MTVVVELRAIGRKEGKGGRVKEKRKLSFPSCLKGGRSTPSDTVGRTQSGLRRRIGRPPSKFLEEID